MQIDRSKFFALTTAISTAVIAAMAGATGCSSTKDTGASDAATQGDTGNGGLTDGSSNVDAGECLGDTGHASCVPDGGVADPTCEGACDAAMSNFKTGVAEAITSCILTLPTCEGATDAVASCGSNAIARACEDTTATTFCDGLAATCNGDGGGGDGGDGGGGGNGFKSKCLAIAPALNATGREAFTTCATSEGCETPIDQCISQLRGGF